MIPIYVILVIAIITVTFLIVGGAYLWHYSLITKIDTLEQSQAVLQQKLNATADAEEDEATDTEEEDVEEAVQQDLSPLKSAIEAEEIAQDYQYRHGQLEGFISLEKGNSLVFAKKALAKLYENEEIIQGFYFPKSPANENVIFLSTSVDAYNLKTPHLNKIYSYNIKTGEITELYEEKVTNDRLLRTMGIEGSKLILMVDMIDNSPGPCFSIWAHWDDFEYLELSDVNAGLESYKVPAYQVNEGRKESEKCEEQMKQD